MTMPVNSLPSASVIDPALAELVEEFTRRLHAGEHIDFQEFASAHPEWAKPLGRLLPALEALADLSASLHPESSPHLPEGPLSSPSPPWGDGRGEGAGQLGEYRIIREVGRGGMGIVYEAVQSSLGRRVALKVLPFAAALDDKRLRRFKQEAQAAAQLHHTNIVPVFSVGCERGVHFFAMQYIEGQTLAAVIRELRQPSSGPGRAASAELSEVSDRVVSGSWLSPCEVQAANVETVGDGPTVRSAVEANRSREFFMRVARLGLQAAEALESAHAQGVIHRDVKPGNLLVDVRGHLWVADFGVARLPGEAGLTMTGDILGTLRYMSPEQALGKRVEVDARSDIYALGATLYELLALVPAIDGRDREEVLRQIAFAEPRPLHSLNQAVPADLETIVAKAMAREPEARYSTAQELADDLRRFLEYKPIRARRPGLVERAGKWARRHRGVVRTAVACLVLSAAGVSASVFLIGQERAEALRQRGKAEEIRKTFAETREVKVRRRHYASDIKEAQRAWQNADRELTIDLLNRHIPREGEEDLRGFEWHHLRHLCYPQAMVLRSHGGPVYHVTFSPDGSLLASASQDGMIILWDPATGREIRRFPGHRGDVNWVAFSPDAKMLASAGDDGTIRLWDRRSGLQLNVWKAHQGEAVAVEFSPDGKLLASGGDDSQVKLWDRATGRLICKLNGHVCRLESLAFSPDGKLLVSSGSDNCAKLWNLFGDGGALMATLSVGSPGCAAVAFSHDGKTIAQTFEDGRVQCWNARDASRGSTYWAFPSHVLSVAFSRDDQLLAVGSSHGPVKIFEVATQQTWHVPGHMGRVWSVAFSPADDRLASAGEDGTVQLRRATRTGEREWLFRRLDPSCGSCRGLVFSPDSRTLAVGSENGSVRLWDIEGDCVRADLKPDAPRAPVGAMAFSPDSRMLAITRENETPRVWDIAAGRILACIRGKSEPYQDVAFSADGRLLVIGGNSVHCYDSATWNPSARPHASTPWKAPEEVLRFSQDAKGLVSGTLFGLTTWDVNLMEKRCTLGGSAGIRTWSGVMFSPDGLTVTGYLRNGTIRLWDARTGNVRFDLGTGTAFCIGVIAIAPDGRTIATGMQGSWIQLWNAATGEELVAFQTPGPPVALAFSPDGTMLAAAVQQRSAEGLSHTVYLWRTRAKEIEVTQR
jgi:WD40 repeat protein/serine/threonine protein kinase